jgi:hypothetical protein
MTAARLWWFVCLVVVIVVPVVVIRTRHPTAHPPILVAPDQHAPANTRVRVQVLNGTKTHGLAQLATQLLRSRGFDVVELGTVSSGRDTTVVLDLSGHPDWAQRVARSFSPARVETRPDSSRYLDVAVVLGTAWRPPAEAFNP